MGFFRSRNNVVATALGAFRRGFWSIALFSAAVNILMLAGPIYMLQVYDRVLASHSLPTLAGLTVFLVAAYSFQAVLDIIRSRVASRLTRELGDRLDDTIHDAIIAASSAGRQREALQPVRDADQVKSFLLSPGPIAIVDAPWIPVFLFLCYLIHPMLGIVAGAGALILVVLAFMTERSSRRIAKDLSESGAARSLAAEARKRNAESAVALGMQGTLRNRWRKISDAHSEAQQRSNDITGGYGAITKVVRLLLQSAMLGLGALLAIRQEISPGAMIASSIMMGRALAPVETAIGQWRGFVAARQSLRRLREQLGGFAALDEARLELPRPHRSLTAEMVTIAAPGSRNAIVQRCDFTAAAGEAVAIIGPSGSGKSSLGRALVGLWRPAVGTIRLDGASLDQWHPDALGKHVGYLSQTIELFDGTVAENIARFEEDVDSAKVLAAAQAAGAHDMILRLPAGYDTPIGEAGSVLSAGQRQRVGLARALYDEPALIVLDEPNSNLDSVGENALLDAVRSAKARRAMVVLITHRPSTMSVCDKVLLISDGMQKGFGPRDEILRGLVKPVASAAPSPLRAVGDMAGA